MLQRGNAARGRPMKPRQDTVRSAPRQGAQIRAARAPARGCDARTARLQCGRAASAGQRVDRTEPWRRMSGTMPGGAMGGEPNAAVAAAVIEESRALRAALGRFARRSDWLASADGAA